MTTTELIELLRANECGGASGRPREVMFEVENEIIETDGVDVVGSGDGLFAELYLSLPDAERKKGKWMEYGDNELHYCSECGWALMNAESGEPPYMGIDYNRSNQERWLCCPGWNEELMNFCPNCGALMRGE